MTTDKELAVEFGMRGSGTPLFEPQEIGYRCPKGHSNITWSEFKKHIWCYTCKKDYHSLKDCVLVEDEHNPKYEEMEVKPIIYQGISNYTEDGNNFNDLPYCSEHQCLMSAEEICPSCEREIRDAIATEEHNKEKGDIP